MYATDKKSFTCTNYELVLTLIKETMTDSVWNMIRSFWKTTFVFSYNSFTQIDKFAYLNRTCGR
jgi:hypothetical protein